MNDTRTNRNRQESLANLISRIPSSPPDGARSILVKTTTETTYPTTASSFYAVFSVDVDGAETEGATPTFNVDSHVFHALNLGSTVPPAGTIILAECLGGLWLFRWDS